MLTKELIMKRRPQIILTLLLAVFSLTLFAQNPTTIAAFMKVNPGQGAAYLEVEQAWKKIHEKGVELGLYNGWQLWLKLHRGTEDPYDYITLQWYDDYAQTFGEDAPEGWQLGLFTEEEAVALSEKTIASRDYVHEMVSSLVTTADVQGEVKYIVVSWMKVNPGMETEYVNMEKEIYKLWAEELISREQMSYWGIWNVWPYAEGESRYFAVQGFANVEQLAGTFDSLTPGELGLDMSLEELMELTQKTREMVRQEVWVLVDQVWAEEE
jgi:hypothetical protein